MRDLKQKMEPNETQLKPVNNHQMNFYGLVIRNRESNHISKEPFQNSVKPSKSPYEPIETALLVGNRESGPFSHSISQSYLKTQYNPIKPRKTQYNPGKPGKTQ